jgi:LysM repeat protein
MKKFRLLVPLATIAAVLLLLIAPAGALAAPDQGNAGPGCVQWHYVRCGQTLASIARMYGTSVSYLAAINGIANPNRIYAGQSLCVRKGAAPPPPKPGPHPGPGPKPCSDGFTYVVRHGETLSSIGWRYGWSAAYLAQVNHIWNPNVIYAGQRLWIPGHGCW